MTVGSRPGLNLSAHKILYRFIHHSIIHLSVHYYHVIFSVLFRLVGLLRFVVLSCSLFCRFPSLTCKIYVTLRNCFLLDSYSILSNSCFNWLFLNTKCPSAAWSGLLLPTACGMESRSHRSRGRSGVQTVPGTAPITRMLDCYQYAVVRRVRQGRFPGPLALAGSDSLAHSVQPEPQAERRRPPGPGSRPGRGGSLRPGP